VLPLNGLLVRCFESQTSIVGLFSCLRNSSRCEEEVLVVSYLNLFLVALVACDVADVRLEVPHIVIEEQVTDILLDFPLFALG